MDKRTKPFFAVLLAAGLLLALAPAHIGLAAASCCPPDAAGGAQVTYASYVSPKQETDELTKLSIQQLLNVDVIPVDVLGTHTHLAHQLMLGVREQHMTWNGNQAGTHSVSLQDLLSRYPVAHDNMSMDMDMFEVMYATSDNSTYMAMLPYTHMYMNHVLRTGGGFPTYSTGWGDLTLQLNQTVAGNVREQGPRWVANAGLSLPTGQIDKTYKTPFNPHAELEYMMQTGSGTVDLLPGVTFIDITDRWAFGSQLSGTIRTGTNYRHYRLGNVYQLDGWDYYKLNDWAGPSVRLSALDWDNIHGADPQMNPAENPEYDPKQQGGKRLDLFLGINLYAPRGHLRGSRLTFEYGWPIYQDLDGAQVRYTSQWTLDYNYTFGT